MTLSEAGALASLSLRQTGQSAGGRSCPVAPVGGMGGSWVLKEIAGSGSSVVKCGLTRFSVAAILAPVNYVPTRVKRSSMMSARNTFFLIVGIFLFIIVAWTFNPMVWRVHRRFPSAKVSDLYENPFVPAFLHPYFKPNDVYDGTYLDIEIWDSTVDLNRLRGIPFCWVRLHRCKVSDLSLLREMDILELNREVSFFDCDLSAVPPEQFLGFGPYDGRSPRFFYGAPRDPKHFSFDKAP